MEEDKREWVLIAETFYMEEAMAWRDLLTGTGIEVSLRPEVDHVELYPGGSMADSYELWVPKEKEEIAKQEIEELQSTDTPSED